MKQRKQQLRCSYCGSPAVLKPASEIYHDPNREGCVYACSHYPVCDAYVSVFPGSKVPMGTLANSALRKKRILAHQTFDQLWKSGIFTRNQAYQWIADKLGLSLQQTHIALFGEYFCDQVIAESRKVLENHRRRCVA